MDPRRQSWSRISRLLNGEDPIGPLAVLNGFITESQLQECLAEQRRQTPVPPLHEILTARGLLTPDLLAELRRQVESGEAGALEAPATIVRRIGRYGLVEQLGVGGAGIVWKAWDLKLRRWVALKQPRSDQGISRERFLREAQAAAKLHHPNLIEVFEIGEEEGQGYIVMDYVEARTLDQVTLDPRAAARLMAEVCDAVQSMHAAGVLHRDIKPQNILVDARGVPHLGDFGLAKIEGNEPLTREGTLLGTPLYMAPEQASKRGGAVGPATDIYGLGATLFHALTGRPPFAEETNLETLFEKLMTDRAPSPIAVQPDTPRELDVIVRRALEPDPRDRYASAAALGEDLRRFGRDEPILAQAPTLVRRGVLWIRRNRRLAAVSAAALLALGAAVGYAFLSGEGLRERQRAYADARGKGDDHWGKAAGHARGGEGEAARKRASAEEAIRWYDLAAHAMGDDPYPLLMRGRCFVLLGRPADAEGAWTEALRRRASYGPALFERGKLWLGGCLPMRLPRRAQVRGRTVVFGPPDPEDDSTREWRRKGEEDLAAARKSSDLEAPLLAYLEGVRSLGAGDYAKAVDALTGYVDNYPWDPDGLGLLGVAQYYSGRLEAAESSLKRAADLSPQSARFRRLGDVRYARGRPRDAAAAYAEALALDPADASTWCNRGLAREADRNLSGALSDFRKAIELRPHFARAHKSMGTALYEQGDWAGARRSFERAAADAELDADAHYNLGSVLLRLKEIDAGIQEFRVAIEIDPDSADAHLGLGAALLMKGERDGAAELLERAAKLDDGNPDAHYHLALARWAQGNPSGARKSMECALDRGGPEWTRIRDAEERLREWRRP